MKHYGLIICLLVLAVSGRAGEQGGDGIRELFKQMPDTLLSTLSENNRLDMIDFIDSKMKAEVTNLLNGQSEMLALTDDSLCVRLSDALTIRMLLLKQEEVTDSCEEVICLAQTFGTDSLSLHTKIEFYTPQWRKLDARPHLSLTDEKRIETMNVQTILKWETEMLKKN